MIPSKLLLYPHYRMNVFCGTNNLSEFKTVLKSIILNKNLIKGESIKTYQNGLKQYLNNQHVYTFSSGRMGFYSILKAIKIQKGEEVIIPSYTCAVVPNAIIYCGAKPIYCDITSKDFNIDISKIESLITHKTRVLYAQHTFGQMCDIEAILALANKYNLIVVEDAALAMGAMIHSKQAGTFGDFGYYSTDRSKVINTGLGGIVTVNNKQYKKNFEIYYDSVPFLDHDFTRGIAITFLLNVLFFHPLVHWVGRILNWIFNKLNLMVYFKDELILTIPEQYPYPAKLSNILSVIGISQLKQIESNIHYRKNVARYYNNILKIYSENYLNDSQNIFLRYSFLVKNRNQWEKRFSSKIDLSIWFKTVAEGRGNDFEAILYRAGSNKTSEFVTEHIFNLPTHKLIIPKKLTKLLYELKHSKDIITEEYNL